MKYRLPIKHCSKGFTIVEVVVSIMVFSAFLSVLMYLYSRSNESFKITLWKQQRTAQAEIFWSFMRKHLEEATNELKIDQFSSNPNISFDLRPLKFHPNPTSVANGNILAWNSSKVHFVFVPTPNHKIDQKFFFLCKDKKRLELRSGRVISKIDDVSSVNFNITSVKKGGGNEEFLDPGADPSSVGTILEISIILSPPDGYMAKDLKIPQNHKFRLNVGSMPDPSPAY